MFCAWGNGAMLALATEPAASFHQGLPTMSGKKLFYLSSLVILPAMYLVFYVVRLSTRGQGLERSLKWEGLLLLATLILLERIYTYRSSVSQRSLLTRDIIAKSVNKYVTDAV